jgi:transcriptional regulator with XRE-family HTH domain
MAKAPIRIGMIAKAALSHFAALLRVQRKERKLTLDELADRLGVSTPTVRKILEGSPSVAIGSYFEAARILGMPLFDPDPHRFAVTASRTAEVESLLPKRVRTRQQEIDDNF